MAVLKKTLLVLIFSMGHAILQAAADVPTGPVEVGRDIEAE